MSHFHTSCSFRHSSHRLYILVLMMLLWKSILWTYSKRISPSHHCRVRSTTCIQHIALVTKLPHTLQSITIPYIETISLHCSILLTFAWSRGVNLPPGQWQIYGGRQGRSPPKSQKMACFIHYFSCVILCILFICIVEPHQFYTISVKRSLMKKDDYWGGDYLRSNFNYRNIWDNLVREVIVFVKGRFPGILIILHVLASLVL